MKKVIIALGVIAVVVIGGIWLLITNLDRIVESAIETAGTRALGSEVAVGRVELDLLAGTASIFDFTIANPPGYTAGDMASFRELSVILNLLNTDGQNLHVSSVTARGPYVFYETSGGMSNFETVGERFSAAGRDTAVGGSRPYVRVDSIVIEDIRGTLQSDRLPVSVEVSLGDIRLQNVEGYPEELAGRIMVPVFSQLGCRAALALLEALGEDGALNRLRETLDGVGDRAEEALDRVGNLLREGDDE